MSPLHQWGEMLRQALMQIPLGAARALFLTFLTGLLVWVLLLPKCETTRAGREGRLSENLKLWAAIALGIQVIIYSLL